MAQNPFSKTNNFVRKPKRNTYDLSFQNNATFNFGTLYPVMCKEIIPGDSYRIEPTFALKFMPMVFPVQTRMNANLHFFYVRNRNLYKDWPDFIAKNKTGLTPPYISIGLSEQERYSKMFGTGSLGDYLGVPSVLAGSEYGASTFVITNPWQRCINRFFYRGTNQSQSHASGVNYDFFDRQDIIDSLNRDAYITNADESNWRVSLLKNDVSSAPVDCINSGDVFGIYKIGNLTPDLIAQLSDYTGPLELTLSCVRDTTPEWITAFSNHREYLSQVLLQSVLFLFDLDSYSGSASVKPLIHYFSTLPSIHYYEQQGGQVGGLLRYDISWKVSRSEFLDFLQKRQEGHTYALCFASYWALYGIQDVGSVSPFGDGQAMTFASLVYTPDFIFRQNGSLTYLSQNVSNSQRDGYLSASSASYNGVTYSFGTSVRSYDVSGITEVSVSSSPFVSVNTFLQSIIPAPVFSLNCLTKSAVIINNSPYILNFIILQ